MPDFLKEFGIVALSTAFILTTLFVGATTAVNHAMLPIRIAEIDQLRRDVANTEAIRSEDVVGQAAKWNQQIMANKAYNRSIVFDFMVPDAWNDVELINIPSN